MIWKILILSFGLASARAENNVHPEFLDELRSSGQDEKLAELLGVDVNLVKPDNSEERSEGSRYNHVSHLGDILLTEEQERQGLNFNYYTNSKWPNGRVPYYISRGNDFTNDQRNTIQNAIKSLNAKLRKVQLVEYGGEEDYVWIFSGNGCYSTLGRKGGYQGLSLQNNGCVNKLTVQHECIHAIGMTHEHNRSDRDDYVTMLWDNIPETWKSQYQKVNDRAYVRIGPYDYYSCMHYEWWAPETYKDAFKFPKGVDKYRVGKGQDEGATDTDIQKIETLYS